MTHSSVESSQKGIIAWFVRNPVASNLLMIFIIILGLVSSGRLSKAITPKFNVSAISVSVPYPGASSSEVESAIVIKVEEAIKQKNIQGIQRIRSTSRESLSQTMIEISDDVDINNLANEIKLALDGIENLPAEAKKPVINKVTQSISALNIQIHGAALDEVEGNRLVNEVKNELLSHQEISTVEIYGNRNVEIAVEVREQTLRKYGLTLGHIASAINASSVDVPAGSIKTNSGELLIRAKGRELVADDFKTIPIRSTLGGERILLGDIANIFETFEETLNSNTFDGEYSVGLGVFASDGEDIITIADISKKYIQQRQASLPSGIQMTIWGETVIFLEQRLNMMYKNLLAGILLVLVCLAIFMNLSIAFWVMLGIPVCFLGVAILLPSFDVSINVISLFGFILVLGVVVDDAIIIGESAHSAMRAEQSDGLDTVLRGIHRVSTPAIFGVLTTVCAFLPTVFISGKWAHFPAACGYVVIFCLIFSLIESKLILPAHIAHSGGISKLLDWKWQKNLQEGANSKIEWFVSRLYQPFLRVAVHNRYITVSVFFAVLMMTVMAVYVGFVRYSLSPDVPSDYISVTLEMPQGTSDETMLRVSDKTMNALRTVEQRYIEETGAEQSFVKHRFVFKMDRSSQATVQLIDESISNISPRDIVQRWQKEVGNIVGAKSLRFSDAQEEKVGAGGDISYNLSSNNEEHLYKAAVELKRKLLEYEGVSSVIDGVPDSSDEIQFALKPNGDALGLSLASIGRQVRDAFHGAEAQSIQRQMSEVKVKVRYPVDERRSLVNLYDMHVRTDDGRGAPITSVADVDIKSALVERVRINGKQAVTVTSKLDKSIAEPSKITGDMLDKFFPKLIEKYPGIKIEAAGGSKDDAKLETELMFGFMLSLIGVYALLAIPLRSYMQPFIIMSVIPFGIIGAIIGHKVMGMAVSMMSIFGIIALSGVVVNDSLILVDFINKAREQGRSLMDAVIDSGGERFRAIFLTSVTTFLGVFPILLETSKQAQFVIPMAISLGFGIVFATVITLIFIPCLYLMLEDLFKGLRKLLGLHQDDAPASPEATS
ncbi:MAG: efflux RND transporter permease subunit [Pseudomonadota bacterium]